MTKFYRVKKTNFLWKAGAILKLDATDKGYRPIEDIWDNTTCNSTEYISTHIVEHENNKEFFERVYQDSLKGSVYKTKDQLVATYYQKAFK